MSNQSLLSVTEVKRRRDDFSSELFCGRREKCESARNEAFSGSSLWAEKKLPAPPANPPANRWSSGLPAEEMGTDSRAGKAAELRSLDVQREQFGMTRLRTN